ncbi:hypothetical protein [Mucilaginibacter lappiensis]|uniref:Uncharacterized protein n=1 Tax=Mucilaginibacter lappiensis TaxID=354630 RepID=A0A841JI58_9SPHI|nr:hypothetical protein [Mucilaginibacter lappiensis]MBB6130849.1 hypothetical protein [Mucilaginibacter lappiensis]
MKSIWLFILMMGGVAQLNAQQLIAPLPGKKPDNSIYQYFKVKPDDGILKLTPVIPNTLEPIPTVPTAKNLGIINFTDNMPIAKLRSTDKMPFFKTDEPNMHYTMLIKRLSEAKTDSVVKTIRP